MILVMNECHACHGHQDSGRQVAFFMIVPDSATIRRIVFNFMKSLWQTRGSLVSDRVLDMVIQHIGAKD